LRLERERRDRKDTGEVFKIDFGGGGRTLGYLIREELQKEKLRIKAGRRASKFEERLLGRGVSWRDCTI